MKNYLSESEGSFTLEAAVVFPVFLGFMIFLINFINVAMVYLAMDHAVSETVKQIAAHAYPLQKINVNTVTSSLGQVSGQLREAPKNTGQDGGNPGNQLVLAAGTDIFNEVLGKVVNKGTEYVLESVIKEVAQSRIKEYYPLGKLSDEDFKITQVRVFNPGNPTKTNDAVNNNLLNNEDIAIVVVYKVKIPMPFLPLRDITLSNTAVERAWVDG